MSIFSHEGMSEAERIAVDYPYALTFEQHEALAVIHPLTVEEARALAALSLKERVALLELNYSGRAWNGGADSGYAHQLAFADPNITHRGQ